MLIKLKSDPEEKITCYDNPGNKISKVFNHANHGQI